MKSGKQKIKHMMQDKQLRNGIYSVCVALLVLAIAILINLGADRLHLRLDVSKQKIYTLTKETKDLVKSVPDKIVLYYITDQDSQNDIIKQVVDQYGLLSRKLKVVQKDPIVYPKFASQYTEDTLENNSVIVVNQTRNRFKVIPYQDMLQTEIDYQTYSQKVTGIDVEGQVSSAIEFVMAKKLPKMYCVTGHGEAEISDILATSLQKQNIQQKTLQTLSADRIPKDCDVLLINGPQHDFTEEEVNLIEDYMEKGGNTIVLTTYTTDAMPNLEGFLERYGIQQQPGVVIETRQSNYMSSNQTYLIPNIESHDITSDIQEKQMPVVFPIAKGFRLGDPIRTSMKVEPFLETSKHAFSKQNVNTASYKREEQDLSGPFYLGVAVTDDTDIAKSKLIAFSSAYCLDSSMLQYSQLGNSALFLSSLRWMTGQSSQLSVPVRSLEQAYITVNAAQARFFGILLVAVIPMIILLSGVFVYRRRRK